ncbi:hydantoinase/oxoprolinase family protein [Candidatus Formimonas warabiya]|uniref:Hydantoinase/oxoprolinase family protein n=1 Tax=Formimonas warabiya TaxID=1761012 RepID=A0A3G1KP68_FORW1|nr:hydantoinase/oxoprolinase family protein [Candidatus Formimonas warabiya]ATW24247.1 hypothetical protein DCMF_05110 [Candidatus Formimonas warabiya]
MNIGIDVGGTFTDTVLVHQGKVITSFKTATTANIMTCINETIRQVSREVPVKQWDRLVISTTMLTNIVAQSLFDQVAILIIPGPGINPHTIKLPGPTFFLKGAINFRGQEIETLDEKDLAVQGKEIYQTGYRHVALVGKFSGRNGRQEIQAAELMRKSFPDLTLTLGHQISGQLNFPRRCVTTWLTAATQRPYRLFLTQLENALQQAQVSCPVFIMKADGGVIPLQAAANQPAATVFSGPAASTLGACVLTPPEQSSVIMDVGGTTTDLAMTLSGIPLMASKGLRVNGFLTHVRSLSVKPVPLGGDSPVEISHNLPLLGTQRKGKAACFGGDHPTLTDAVNIVHHVPGTHIALSRAAFERVLGIEPDQVLLFSQEVISYACHKIAGAIGEMIQEWQDEPAYQVWQVVQKAVSFPRNLVGIGGAAPILTQQTAKLLNMEPSIPPFYQVANALGCAVAKPSLTLNLHIDTVAHHIMVLEEGWQEEFHEEISEKKAVKIAKEMLVARAKKYFLHLSESDIELVNCETFSVLQGYYRSGYIINVEVQIRPDLTRIH